MAVIVNGDGILTGISSLATSLTDITSGRGTITGVTTVGTLQLGAGVSISSPRSQTAAIFTNNTEFFTVDDAGRVGVGTITPNSDAHPQNEKKINVGFITAKSIAGDIDARNVVIAGVTTSTGIVQAAQFKLLDNAKALYGDSGDLQIYHSTNSLIQNGTGSLQIVTTTGDLFLRGQDNITFNTAGNNERLRIDSSGLVQIATTSGNDKLNVAGAIRSSGSSPNFSAGLEGTLVDYDTSNNLARFGHVSGASGSARSVVFVTGGIEKMRLDSSGNFLVGTTTQAGKFTVDSGTSNTCATFQSSDAGAGINLKDNNARSSLEQNATDLKISSDTAGEYANSTIRLQVDGATKMLIDSNGKVGIGENTPLAQLHIKPPSNMSQLLLEQNNAADGYALFQDGPNGGHLKFMRHIGGSESQKMLLRSDGGLCFGTDSGTGNALDDYEEGVFTPTLTGGNLSGGIRQGYYVKIGQHVMVTMLIQWTANSGAGGQVGVGNFPFVTTNVQSGYHRAGAAWGFTQGIDNQGNKQLTFNINANVSAGGIHVINDNGGAIAIGAQDCNAQGEMQLTVNYRSA